MRAPWDPQPRPVWAGFALRYSDGALLTVQLEPFEARFELRRDYEDIRSFGGFERRLYAARPEVDIELRGVITDDSHWSRWRTAPAPAGDRPAATRELPQPGRREIGS